MKKLNIVIAHNGSAFQSAGSTFLLRQKELLQNGIQFIYETDTPDQEIRNTPVYMQLAMDSCAPQALISLPQAAPWLKKISIRNWPAWQKAWRRKWTASGSFSPSQTLL